MVLEIGENVARFDESLTGVQKKFWRIFIGSCVLSVIIVFLLVTVMTSSEDSSHSLLVVLTSLLLWSGIITAYAFHSLHLFTQQIRTELARKTFVDEITQVFNFRYLDRRLAEECERVRRYGGTAAVLYMDLDHFKQVNDRYGHQLGNVVLQQIATTMAERMRACDVLGRIGGDEFTALLPQTSLDGARVTAERLARCVADYRLDLGDRGVIDFVTVSIGVAAYPEHGDSMETVVSAADSAVYAAKGQGGNAVCMAGAPKAGAASPTSC